jgi:hypothetical protein
MNSGTESIDRPAPRKAALRGVTRQLLVAASALIMVAVNLAGGGGGGFNGSGSNDVYSAHPTAFTPAVYTFAVWAPIFIGALALAVYQALPSRRDDSRLDVLGLPLVIAYLLNAATVYTQLGLSNVVMFLLLGTLAWAFVLVARMGRQERTFFWFVRAPLAILFGWITAATILNTFQYLAAHNVAAFGTDGSVAAAASMLLAAGLAVFITVRYREAVYSLTVVWAAWGIAAAHSGVPSTVAAAAIGTLAVLAAIAYRFRTGRADHVQHLAAHQ